MAKDIYHKIVRAALEKDDWEITADPYKLGMSNRKPLEVDLAAEKIIAAEKGTQKIAVEIKSFLSDSFMRDWYTAVGQYLTYNQLIADKEGERILFWQYHSKFMKILLNQTMIFLNCAKYSICVC